MSCLAASSCARRPLPSNTGIGFYPQAEEVTPEQLGALSCRWRALAPGGLFLHTGIGFYPLGDEVTPEELDVLSGGELLRQEASSFTQVLAFILKLRR
jgi:hypothetical protein